MLLLFLLIVVLRLAFAFAAAFASSSRFLFRLLSPFLLFAAASAPALRVPRAETRLTVYRAPYIDVVN